MVFNTGHALVVGVSSHQYHREVDIPISVQDAEAVARVLQDENACGYPPGQVHILHGNRATKQGILSALDRLASVTEFKSTIFFFFCGHGTLGTDGNYHLVSHDVQLKDGRIVAGTGVSETELLDKLRAIKAQRLLMIIDACYSGNVSLSRAPQVATRDLRLTNPPEETTMALLGTGSGRIVITSCRENQVSYIGQSTLSIFTQALVDGLRGKGVKNNHGMISAFGLYEQLYTDVREAVRVQIQAIQEPELTVHKGVGPFAVALYKGASHLGDFDSNEALPHGMPVREVTPEKSLRLLSQRVVNTDGGAYVGGSVPLQGGGFVGRDKTIHGDEVRGDKVGGDKIEVGNISGSTGIAIGRDAQAHVNQAPSGTELKALFAPLIREVQQAAPQEQRKEAVGAVLALQEESAKGPQASDSRLAKLLEEVVALVPSAISTVVAIFATPVLSGIAGDITNYVLEKLRGQRR